MSIFGDPSADVVVSQQAWIAITAEAEKLAAMAKECAAERGHCGRSPGTRQTTARLASRRRWQRRWIGRATGTAGGNLPADASELAMYLRNDLERRAVNETPEGK